MKPVPWNTIKFETDGLDYIVQQVWEHEGANPACKLGEYWMHRMSPKMMVDVIKNRELPYGFVGDGWPIKSDQTWALQNDGRGLKEAFAEHDCRDVGDAIYQANTIMDHMTFAPAIPTRIVDFGVGYGRLAIPFIWKFPEVIQYIGVDYSPISLFLSTQFVYQALSIDMSSVPWLPYVSLPAWNVEMLKEWKPKVFISIHSFQEMERETVDFYVNLMEESASPGAIFYSVNLFPKRYVPGHWRPLFDRKYPINRDGSYNERLWRIK